MKVVLTIRDFYPGKGGGISYTLGLARSLVKRGVDAFVVTSSRSLSKAYSNIDGVKVFRTGYIEYQTQLLDPFRLYTLLKSLDPDVVHTNDPSIVGDETLFAAKRISKPIVTTYHADARLRGFPGAYMRFKTRLLPRYDRIIVTTTLYRRVLCERGVPCSKVAVIPIGIDYQRFANTPREAAEDLREKLGLGDKRVLLFVGGLTVGQLYKRPDLLLVALRILGMENVALLVVGQGALLGYYKSLAERLEVGDKVLFLGEVPEEDLPKFYRLADILVLPSPTMREGFGIVLLEAMASGCPVITSTRAGGSMTVLLSGAGLLYEAYNARDLAAKIEHLLENESLRREMGSKGREYAKRHDWSRIVGMFIELYEDVTSEKRVKKWQEHSTRHS